MEMVTDLRQRHLAGWTKALRDFKPDDVSVIKQLPIIEFDGISLKAAIVAGWFSDVTDPDVVDDMKMGEVHKLSELVWEAFSKANEADPN